MKRFAWGAAVGVIGWFMVQGVALAGWEVTAETTAQKKKTGKEISWYQANRLREDAGGTSTVMDFPRKKVIWIDHEKKKYSVMTFDEFRAKVREAAATAGDAMEKMKAMGMSMPGRGSASKGKITVTGIEGASVAGYQCDGYQVAEGGKTRELLWVTRKAPFLTEIGPDAQAEFEALTKDIKKLKIMGGYDDDPAYRKAIEGGHLMKMQDKESGYIHEVTKMEKMDIPSSKFEEPRGYAKASFEEMTGMSADGHEGDRGVASMPDNTPGGAMAPAVDYGKQAADEVKGAAKEGAMAPVDETKQGILDGIREGTKEGIKKLFKW